MRRAGSFKYDGVTTAHNGMMGNGLLAIGSIVQVNGQKVSDAERMELGVGLRNGDRVDKLFLYKHGKSRMWYGQVDLTEKCSKPAPTPAALGTQINSSDSPGAFITTNLL